jgi:phenylalanyl-tRNA synthetase beta chain
MKISLNWLKDYLKLDHSPERIAEILTDTGLEVEGLEKVESVKGGLNKVVIGEILTVDKHPDADRLKITTVDVAEKNPLQIVCGANNVAVGQKVVVAMVGAILYPKPEEVFKIKKSKIRGVESEGMICAEDELGLGDNHDGILVLDAKSKVGTLASEFFELEDDYLIEIGLTPNRSDAMGHIGVARDLKAFLNYHEKSNLEICQKSADIPTPGSETISIEIKDTAACPRYSGAVITGLKVEPSPTWLQNRLRIIGLNPINNLVDITNYVMHETGNPLHAFDLTEVKGKIIVRKAIEGEKIITLDEEERELSTEDLLICNEKEPICIAGVFGGLTSGVKDSTTAIFLEAACFNPVSVRKTAKFHGLNTDSSFRFERGIDPNNVDYALQRAISMILEIAGGKLGAVQDLYPNKIEECQVKFNPKRSRTIMGVDISDEDMISILRELDIITVKNDKSEMLLSVPTYRVDVTREADITEEILRIYGFNNVPLPKKLNTSITYRTEDNNEKIQNLIANYLVDKGLFEIMNNSLTSSEIWDKIETHSFDPKRDVKILNPLSKELDVLRQTLFFDGLKSIQHNQNRQHSDVKFFEFGSDYRFNPDKEERYPQRKKLSIWLTGNKQEENWTTKEKEVDFFYLKGIVESILVKLGIFKGPVVAALLNDIFEDGYNYAIAKRSVVDLGWIRRDILDQFDIKKDVYYASFDWTVIEEICVMNRITAKQIPKTQFARRDFSLLINDDIHFHEIRDLARDVDKKILKKVGLFDVYDGKNLPQGKKSYAVNFIFQDNENTLKDQQIEEVMELIRKKLEVELGAELR